MTAARSVADIDWVSWTPAFRATLLFVVRGGEVLLIRKRRGLGAGKINGPGGKLDPGETALECAIRETHEEVRITPTGVRESGRLRFQFVDGTAWDCTAFTASGFDGTPTETEEATPLWCPVDAIPYREMWADDELWLPHLLAGRRVDVRCVFDDEVLVDAVVEVG